MKSKAIGGISMGFGDYTVCYKLCELLGVGEIFGHPFQQCSCFPRRHAQHPVATNNSEKKGSPWNKQWGIISNNV